QEHLLHLLLAPAHAVAERDRLHHAPAPAAELAAHRDGLAGGRVGDDEIVAAVRPIDRHGRRSDVLHHQTGCRSAIVDDVVAARPRVDVLVDAAFAGEVLVPDPGYYLVVAIALTPALSPYATLFRSQEHLLHLLLAPAHAVGERDRLQDAPAPAAELAYDLHG